MQFEVFRIGIILVYDLNSTWLPILDCTSASALSGYPSQKPVPACVESAVSSDVLRERQDVEVLLASESL